MRLHRIVLPLCAALAAGCADTVSPVASFRPDATAPDAPVATPDVDVVRDVALTDLSRVDTPDTPPPPPPEVLCGGIPCAAGEVCCLATGRCFDPATDAASCTAPPPAGGDRPCASNLDCPDDQFCQSNASASCVGAGHCHPRSNCGMCLGAHCEVCGCDGVTYPSRSAACIAGVRTATVAAGACGAVPVPEPMRDPDASASAPTRIPCARSSQCPSRQSCCPLTGVCFDEGCPDCCRAPPPGTDFPCRTDADCYPSQWCRGEGCGTPGGCAVRRPTGECPGAVDPVCGCDGRTYISACWALSASVRVASTGECPAR
ncbi:MAG: Kazal-type serine protease inhibitor [Polyangiales bacterium]